MKKEIVLNTTTGGKLTVSDNDGDGKPSAGDTVTNYTEPGRNDGKPISPSDLRIGMEDGTTIVTGAQGVITKIENSDGSVKSFTAKTKDGRTLSIGKAPRNRVKEMMNTEKKK